MKFKHFINPFAYFSDKILFVSGLIITIIGIILSYIFNIIQDGYLDLHLSDKQYAWYVIGLLPIMNIAICTIGLYLLSYFFINKKIRWIDIINTVMIARLPSYLSMLLFSNQYMDSFEQQVNLSLTEQKAITFEPVTLTIVLLISFVTIFCIAYHIYLLFRGFKEASNAKKISHYILFGVMLIIIEIITSYLATFIIHK